MKKFLLIVTCAVISFSVYSQDKPAYVLFDKNGRKIKYSKMVNSTAEADVVLFGEFHDNPIAHWLQLELTRDLKEKRSLVLGAEMFEADNQQALNDYLQGKISAKGLDSAARLWPNYNTDYAPLVNFAKKNNISFAATNIPRRYASMIARGGFEVLDTLSDKEKNWIAPLPIAYDSTLPGYTKMLETMKGHGGPNLPRAQASKDATMAHFIVKNIQPGSLFIHYNGAFHSENYDGIVWYLKKQRPDLKYATITIVSQKEINKLLDENKNKADFIICVDEDMTSTY
jgi:uncharacterized iron-regulated protein